MKRLLQPLVEHNPFYLLSALCMLLGCFTLSHALRLDPGQPWKLLLLLATLHVYELLLVGLGLFLIERRALPRDGRILLLIEVPFLADATLLNAEAFGADVLLGGLANLACLMLAAAKLALISSRLGVRLGALGSAAYGHGLALVIATPALLALLAQARALTTLGVYAAWWPLGVLIVLSALAVRRRQASSPAAESFLDALAVALPASLGLHLIASGWVYQIGFRAAFLAPVLIGLGVARMLLDVRWLDAAWCLRLPAAGVLLSLADAWELRFPGPFGLTLSPFRAALAGAALAYLFGWRLLGQRAFAWSAAVCGALGLFGHSPAAVLESAGALLRGLKGAGARLVPKSATAWGALAVGASFVLLVLGACVSLLKAPAQPSPVTPRARVRR